MIKKNTGLSKSNNADTSDMFAKEKKALAAKRKRAEQTIAKNKAQRKADAEWASKMANNGSPITVPGAFDGQYGFNKSFAPQDTASVPATPSANQGKIDADKQAFMQNKPKSVAKNTEWNAGKDFSGIDSGVKNTTFNPNKQGTQENPNKSVASGTGKGNPLLYKNPSWRNNLGLNQDDEMVATVDDTASAPTTPQRNLPASVYDGEGPESVTSSGRDARQSAAVQKRRQGYRDDDLPDPYATRIMPGQMTQKQIDARNASDSKFARDAQGKRKQSMAKALINPPSSDNDELITQIDQQRDDGSEFEVRPDTAGVAARPSKDPGPVKVVQDPSFGQGEKRKEAEKGTGNQFDDMTAIDGSTPGGEEGPTAGGTDTNTTDAKLQKDLKQIAKPVRPEPGTGAKAFAKQLGYSSFAEFLRANEKNVNKAANGNWVVHPNKDYIPAK